jgi:predicted GNAT superfamily acetyltransferase
MSIEWTFDPLVRRNAYFNLVKLGADAVEYLVDFYGPMEDGINAGDESDRILVRWKLDSEKAAAAAAGRPLEFRPDAGALLVPVPDDIVAMRRDDPGLARRWRHQLREALGGAMSRGYRVSGLSRAFEYVLSRD